MFYLCHSQSLLCSELPNIVGLPRLQKKWVPGADQLNWQHAHVPVRVVAWQPEMATNCCCSILLGGLSGRAEVSSQPLGCLLQGLLFHLPKTKTLFNLL